MDALISTLSFAAVLVTLFGVAGVVKPFWLMKRRWHGGVIALAGFVAFGVLNDLPIQRPVNISEAEWAERTKVCREAAQMRECPTNDVMVAEARAKVAEDQREAKAKEELKVAEKRAEEAERLANAREREIAAAGDAVVAGAEKLHDPTQQALWVAATEEAVRNKMRDPGSVRFRNSRFHIFGDGTPMVCGEVNAKNGFGGATGYQRFIASGESFGPVLEEMMSASEFAKTWNQICV
ncbi:MAG: hypothetical protein ACK4FG_04785 [Brevundimonas sp.]